MELLYECHFLVISCKLFLVMDGVSGSELLYGDRFILGKRLFTYVCCQCR